MFIGENINQSISKIESHDVTSLENDFLDRGKVQKKISTYDGNR